MKEKMELKTGDWVEVRSPLEIAKTLDQEGECDGLPFMPEMLPYCGQRFRVLRRAEKTCIQFPDGGYKIREFRGVDVFLLGGLRCSGSSHDGCQRACLLFWKAEWLRRVGGEQAGVVKRNSGYELLGAKLRTRVGPGRYVCQSTELAKATQPLTRSRILVKCFYEVRSGSRGIWEMIGLILAPFWRKVTAKIPRRRLAGELKKTPVGDLQLQPGELVEIKSAVEISQTLDARGRNRGLSCDYGMCQYSGRRYRVRNRLDRMISEATGEMRQVEGTVILEDLHCLCWNVLGGCPRQDFMYWRELWLRRVELPIAATRAKPCCFQERDTGPGQLRP